MSIEQQNESLKERLMAVEHEKFLLGQRVAQLKAQMESIRKRSSTPSGELSPPPESDLLNHHNLVKQELLDDSPFDLPTPQNSFGAPSTSFGSPSTATYSESSTPATISLGFDALTATPDMTQHPAAMLCDLQCQSAGACQAPTPPTIPQQAVTPSSLETPPYQTSTSTVFSQVMRRLQKMISTSSKTGSALPLLTTMSPTLASSSTHLSTSKPQTKRATKPTTKTNSPTTMISTPPTTPSPTPTLPLRLLVRLLLSSLSLARSLRAATGRALRPQTASTTRTRSDVYERVARGVAQRSENVRYYVGVRSTESDEPRAEEVVESDQGSLEDRRRDFLLAFGQAILHALVGQPILHALVGEPNLYALAGELVTLDSVGYDPMDLSMINEFGIRTTRNSFTMIFKSEFFIDREFSATPFSHPRYAILH